MNKLTIGALPGCASTGKTLAQNSAPSPLVMGTAEDCLERAVILLADTDKAMNYCLLMRDKEVDRNKATVDAAARAALAEGRIYVLGDGWQGDGMYSGRYVATQGQYNSLTVGMGRSNFGHGTATGRNCVYDSRRGGCY